MLKLEVIMDNLHLSTYLAQLGNRADEATGAIVAPIHLSATFAHPGLGESTGYDYTRTANPTRTILEEGLAYLESGSHAVATSSGMAAIELVLQLFDNETTYLASRDLYGGTYRYFAHLEDKGQGQFIYYDNEVDLYDKLSDQIDVLFIESPTNPLMETIDIQAACQAAKEHDIIVVVDNTLMTPIIQRPLEEGADIVVHSATKYLGGHNDILAGAVITNREDLGERLAWLANTTGPTLAAFDSWLMIRSLKTLPLRVKQQEANAKEIVDFLKQHPRIKDVMYAGRGAMISIRLQEQEAIANFLNRLQIFSYAESLGGVESLVTYPTTQTHADIPQELRESYGLTPDLLRFSIGIEAASDLIADLNQALAD